MGRMTNRQLVKNLDALGFTQMGFAKAIGVNPRTVRHWIAGTYPVPQAIALLLNLMVEFEVKPEQIK